MFGVKGALSSYLKQHPLNFNHILELFIHITLGQTLTFST